MLTVDKVKALEVILKDLNSYMFELMVVVNNEYNRPGKILQYSKDVEGFNFIDAFNVYCKVNECIQSYLSTAQNVLVHYHHLDELFNACFSVDSSRLYDSKSNEAIRFLAEADIITQSIGLAIASQETMRNLSSLDRKLEVASNVLYEKIGTITVRINEKLLIVLTRVELMVEIINPPETKTN